MYTNAYKTFTKYLLCYTTQLQPPIASGYRISGTKYVEYISLVARCQHIKRVSRQFDLMPPMNACSCFGRHPDRRRTVPQDITLTGDLFSSKTVELRGESKYWPAQGKGNRLGILFKLLNITYSTLQCSANRYQLSNVFPPMVYHTNAKISPIPGCRHACLALIVMVDASRAE